MSTKLVNWHAAFLAALENTGSITEASKAVGVHRVTAYTHKRNDAVFSQLWEQALERSGDLLMEEARKRAFSGSDVLLMFLLKGLQPQR